MQHYVDQCRKTRLHYLEMLAAAFILETGLSASECELVEEYRGTTISWRFRKQNTENT